FSNNTHGHRPDILTMSTFFVAPDAVTPPTIRITLYLLHHLRDSLRLHPGDALTLNDGHGPRYRVEVTHVAPQAIDNRIIDQQTERTRKTQTIGLHKPSLQATEQDLTHDALTGVD